MSRAAPTPILSPLARKRLSEDVAAQLRALVSSDAYAPGDQLPSERDLMRILGVGRPVVREAMQSLERAGLIIIRHGERARIAAPSWSRAVETLSDGVKHALRHAPDAEADLREARLMFETHMARRAAQVRTEQDVATLRLRLEEQRAARGDVAAFVDADGRFHASIAGITRNGVFVATAQAMFGWLRRSHNRMVFEPGRDQVTLQEHEDIVRAIERQRPDEAAAAMERHLNRSARGAS